MQSRRLPPCSRRRCGRRCCRKACLRRLKRDRPRQRRPPRRCRMRPQRSGLCPCPSGRSRLWPNKRPNWRRQASCQCRR
ncbi:hypothetical protein C2134_04150 [Chromobacterium sinusclupearum]|uniref:Uncharacterized protein n=1 Tax=Chromobacterium sinusclupearum TaxID=2077146 RepID=A0A2K4MS96_9NEIS|nr:hypothetical protein C2134_04150 [Chromobacterium sinusclupearum]